METNYKQGMTDDKDIIDMMVDNMSEIEKEQEKSDEEYNQRKEINLLQKQLDLAMRLQSFYKF